MAKLNIYDYGAMRVCIVSGVAMPDMSRRDYVESGKDGLKEIFRRIRADRTLLQAKTRKAMA